MLKTSSIKSAEPRKGGVGVDGDSRARRDRSELDRDEINSGEVGDDKVRKKVQNLSKSKKSSKFKKTIGLNFLTFGARLAFTELRQTFVKALVVHHFDLEWYIQVEMDVSGYAIGGVLS